MTLTTRAMRNSLVSACALGAMVVALVSAQDAPPPVAPPGAAPGAAAPGGGGGGRGGGSAWTTTRGDAQRTAWVRNDQYISVEDFQKPGFDVQWTVTVGRTPGETFSEGVSGNTAQLNPAPGDLAGSASNVYSYEIDTGSIVWTRHLDVPAAARTVACPGGLTSGVTRPTPLSGGVTGATLGRTSGPATYRGAVGAPGEGVPPEILTRRGGGRAAPPGGAGAGAPGAPGAPGGAPAARGAAPAAPGEPNAGGAAVAPGLPAGGQPAGAGAPRAGGPGAPGGAAPAPGAPGGGGRGSAAVYVVSSDGMLRTIGQQEGKEIQQPVRFLPANAHATSIVMVNQTVYTSTINGCGGAANGVWAINIAAGNAVTSWKSGASPVGAVAFSTTGTIYVALGDGPATAGTYANAIVALDPATLAVKDWFTMPGASFSTTPVVFPVSGREMVAAATKDGRVFLLDATSLGGADHRTAVATSTPTNTSKTWSPSALATWQDAAQTRWLALPGMGARGNITAFKVNGRVLEPGWTSTTDLTSPSAPIVVSDVVFALKEGSASAPAVLYALEGATGKELWNSGRSLKTSARSTPLWSINGQVYVLTTDRILYAFGYAQDRHP